MTWNTITRCPTDSQMPAEMVKQASLASKAIDTLESAPHSPRVVISVSPRETLRTWGEQTQWRFDSSPTYTASTHSSQ